MLMIRRELPRTKNADWARRACCIKHSRALLIENTSTATGTALLAKEETRFMGGVVNFDADGPDKTQQLSSYSHYDLRFVFATRQKFLIAQMQAVLSFPSIVSDLLAQSGAITSQRTPRAVSCQYNTYQVGPAS
jgi:hypothetical protein